MSDIPGGWTRLPIGTLAATTKNVNPSAFPTEIFELYSVPSFSNSTPDVVQGKEIKSAKQLVQPGDILLCKIVPHINRVWVVHPFTKHRQIASGEWIVHRTTHHDPQYLRYLLSAPDFRGPFLQTVSGVGGSLMRARPAAVEKIEIPIAPVSEQPRIVAKLDSLSARSSHARRELDRIPILIARYKQAILAKAFSGELTEISRYLNNNKWLSGQRYRQNRQQQAEVTSSTHGLGRDEKTALLIADSDLRVQLNALSDAAPLPATWCWVGLGQIFGTYVGATPSRKAPEYWEGNIHWVSSGEVGFCRISDTEEKITEAGLKNASTRVHPTGTVLLGMIGEGKTRGQAAVLDIPACNNQNCAAIRVSEAEYPPEYLYWYLFYTYETTRTAGAGNNQPALNKDRVQRLPIPLAPPQEAQVIVKAIHTAFSWLDKVATHYARVDHLLPKLDRAILAKAFRGELVRQDPNDEPAEALLKSIKVESQSVSSKRRHADNS